VVHGARRIGREFESAGFTIAADQDIEAGLMYRHLTSIQHVDARRIDIHTQHMVARIGQAAPETILRNPSQKSSLSLNRP